MCDWEKRNTFGSEHEKEKHNKKFPVRIAQTGGGLKNNPPRIKVSVNQCIGMKLEISIFNIRSNVSQIILPQNISSDVHVEIAYLSQLQETFYPCIFSQNNNEKYFCNIENKFVVDISR